MRPPKTTSSKQEKRCDSEPACTMWTLKLKQLNGIQPSCLLLTLATERSALEKSATGEKTNTCVQLCGILPGRFRRLKKMSGNSVIGGPSIIQRNKASLTTAELLHPGESGDIVPLFVGYIFFMSALQ